MGCFLVKGKNQSQKVTPYTTDQSCVHTINSDSETAMKIQQGGLSDNYEIIKEVQNENNTKTWICNFVPQDTMRFVKRIKKQTNQPIEANCKEINQEVEIWRRIKHPNVIKCYEIFEDDASFYIATEYYEDSQILENLIEQRQFTEYECLSIIKQLLTVITVLHSKKIIHRSINPRNIILDKDGPVIKLTGFETSSILTGLILKTDKLRRFSQTLSLFTDKYTFSWYSAPEFDSKMYNEKCDEWSCGILLIALFTGKVLPFEDLHKEFNTSILSGLIELLKEQKIPKLAAELIRDLTQSDTFARMSAGVALTHPWIQQKKKLKPVIIISPSQEIQT
ncbi:unnamed protein product [Blepharisma stoltei]|uniref:Protein kinase domain-containing protein n=1 Tax=Blepharisma stoltei TaxID=1481888 RepID=A0AAU9JAV9_9CILI|nr:unnamed protein product [Blepharisma stoltei]